MRIFTILAVVLISLAIAGGSQPSPKTTMTAEKYSDQLLIDNFDDADISAGPVWWKFDRIETSFPEAKDEVNGLYCLKISGKPESYYVGGMGTYVGKDASKYDTLSIRVKGTGPQSGTLRLQLYDDDNNTYQLEQDSTYKPIYDDYLEYELPITWEGWRTVEVPLTRFVDMNPGVGDDTLNLEQKNGSGGLLHFQFVVMSTSQKGPVNFEIDNIKLVKKVQ